jgi:glycerol-3-phosphate dehydrogenase subunit C
VDITDIITMAKAAAMDNGRHVPLGQKLLNRPDMIGRLGGLAPALSNALLKSRPLRVAAELAFGIDRNAPLPAIKGSRFRKWMAARRQPDGAEVAYFQGCSVEYYDPQVGIDAVRLLNRLGLKVSIPTGLCCSLPKLSSGEVDAARSGAHELVNQLLPAAHAQMPILATSTSCSMTLKTKYRAYLQMDDNDTGAVGRAVVDLCEYLRENHLGQLKSSLKPMRRRVLYHGPCQLRSHHVGLPAIALMRRIPGLDLHLSQADCCGIGGTYGYDVKKSPISKAIGRTLLDQATELKPDLIICDSETCRWNIQSMTGIETIHPAQLLLRSMQSRTDLD